MPISAIKDLLKKWEAVRAMVLEWYPNQADVIRAVILVPDEGGVEPSWKCAGGTDVDTAIGNAGAQMLMKLLELGRLLELDHVTALVSLSLASHDFRVSF
ncbi:hypothetical protein TNCV_4384051 [Trichonephila clavipes]|nr:hypothetical protein TNCV_4384051 [Trichonephila clavipes]